MSEEALRHLLATVTAQRDAALARAYTAETELERYRAAEREESDPWVLLAQSKGWVRDPITGNMARPKK